jgi:putative GTP pyrophosphokinase
MDENNLEILREEYNYNKDKADKLGEAAVGILSKVIKEKKINLGFPIDYRIKDWGSIEEKMERTNLHLHSLLELQDLIGLRVVVVFRREIAEVERIINKEFKIKRQYDTSQKGEPDRFGYSANHYVVTFLPSKKDESRMFTFPNFLLEIQVRTISQHAWAESSQFLQYKREESVPDELKHDLARTSALLEEVDINFEKILSKREEYRSGKIQLDMDEKLNVDLIEKTLDQLWPIENKLENEHYEFLLAELQKNGFTTQRQLTSLVNQYHDKVLVRAAREAENLRRIVEEHPPINGTITTKTQNRTVTRMGINDELISKINKGIYYGHVALTITSIQFEKGERDPYEPIIE